ncbi:2,3-bisphosphoglycerate-dependent phosphoglycerate mutase [Tumebacillus sp. BK434]|uniref:histidine phosphatase family protein n=1 Tax=Tumebacillus sp. BK434 TaxID=2512169 RepID=UPI00104C815C|nr:histidine phosphatase family protein [Tumebacillus sp. BK434]TCP55959.1 2,3-bisphosphoglycerate-dependent phosphoglycerate mutase [Tumebacillus sp. BK434]
MEILLIRHGESEADLLGVHEGRADFSLTGLGRRQVAAMAERVAAELMPERIFSSTLQRAQQTAAVLAETTGVELQFLPDLMEINNGKQAGLPLEEGNRLHPIPALPHVPFADGESWFQFRMRAESVLSEIVTACAGKHERIAIVSHGGMISALIQSFLRMPAINSCYFHSGDTAIHVLVHQEPQRVVKVMNDTKHLSTLA